jgi:hypothetical protein
MNNFKAGDMAMIINSDGGNDGKIVVLTQYHPNMVLLGPSGNCDAPAWEYSPGLIGYKGLPTRYARTWQLRKIDNPGDDAVDEMLLIAGKPRKESVK